MLVRRYRGNEGQASMVLLSAVVVIPFVAMSVLNRTNPNEASSTYNNFVKHPADAGDGITKELVLERETTIDLR